MLQEKANLALSLGADVEIVGCWIWSTFENKPDINARQQLKAQGFHWNAKRKVWQWAGRPAGNSPLANNALKAKYGAFQIRTANELTTV